MTGDDDRVAELERRIAAARRVSRISDPEAAIRAMLAALGGGDDLDVFIAEQGPEFRAQVDAAVVRQDAEAEVERARYANVRAPGESIMGFLGRFLTVARDDR